jgi:hypothetical protein
MVMKNIKKVLNKIHSGTEKCMCAEMGEGCNDGCPCAYPGMKGICDLCNPQLKKKGTNTGPKSGPDLIRC